MKINVAATLLLSAFFAAIPASAAVILDQSSLLGPTFYISGSVRLADAFTITAPATVSSVKFWYYAQYASDLTDLSWAFYPDNAGALDTLLYTGTVSGAGLNETYDGNIFNLFAASFAVPDLVFTPGIYWLELHAAQTIGGNQDLQVAWASVPTGTLGALRSTGSSGPPTDPVAFSDFQHYAYQFDGTGADVSDVPEPATFWPLALGVALLLGAAARRDASRARARPSAPCPPTM